MVSLRLVSIAAIVAVVLVCVDATPVEKTDNPRAALSRTIRSFLDSIGLKPDPKENKQLVKRQSPFTCSNPSQCAPPGVNNTPTSLIDCDNNQCLCRECFESNSSGLCVENDCDDYYYQSSQRECVDDRPSQLTAFLLSLFLSSTGAANFYIGQNGLGAGQLVLLLIIVLFPCVFCYLMCCLTCCFAGDGDEGVKGKLCGGVLSIACTLLASLVGICCGLALWAWWLADLIIFATNKRDAGNGCSLQDDL